MGIVCHIQTLEVMHHVVHWHGYRPQDDTMQPAAHVPQHFIRDYWTGLQKQQKKTPVYSFQKYETQERVEQEMTQEVAIDFKNAEELERRIRRSRSRRKSRGIRISVGYGTPTLCCTKSLDYGSQLMFQRGGGRRDYLDNTVTTIPNTLVNESCSIS